MGRMEGGVPGIWCSASEVGEGGRGAYCGIMVEVDSDSEEVRARASS